MRYSKIAEQFLGVRLKKVHTSLELGNFAQGTGSKRYTLRFTIIRMRRLSGDSKETVQWCRTLRQADALRDRIKDGHRASHDETEWTYYIRDIETGKVY